MPIVAASLLKNTGTAKDRGRATKNPIHHARSHISKNLSENPALTRVMTKDIPKDMKNAIPTLMNIDIRLLLADAFLLLFIEP